MEIELLIMGNLSIHHFGDSLMNCAFLEVEISIGYIRKHRMVINRSLEVPLRMYEIQEENHVIWKYKDRHNKIIYISQAHARLFTKIQSSGYPLNWVDECAAAAD